MRAINTFMLIAMITAVAMTAVHYAVLGFVARIRPQQEVAATADVVATDDEIEKFNAADGAAWVADAKDVAARIARECGEITADDIWNECPPPDGVDGRLMSLVLNRTDWEIVDRRLSARGRNAARQIAVWRMKSAEALAA